MYASHKAHNNMSGTAPNSIEENTSFEPQNGPRAKSGKFTKILRNDAKHCIFCFGVVQKRVDLVDPKNVETKASIAHFGVDTAEKGTSKFVFPAPARPPTPDPRHGQLNSDASARAAASASALAFSCRRSSACAICHRIPTFSFLKFTTRK